MNTNPQIITKQEMQQSLMNRSACVQVGALLHDAACSLNGIYDDSTNKEEILQDVMDGLQAVKHIADILSDKVAGCAQLDEAWEAADEILELILTKEYGK